MFCWSAAAQTNPDVFVCDSSLTHSSFFQKFPRAAHSSWDTPAWTRPCDVSWFTLSGIFFISPPAHSSQRGEESCPRTVTNLDRQLAPLIVRSGDSCGGCGGRGAPLTGSAHTHTGHAGGVFSHQKLLTMCL